MNKTVCAELDPVRPSEEAARQAIESWLSEHAPGYPTYGLCTDGDDGWAFWIVDSDTTSYLHHDLRIEWYGSAWPEDYEYEGDHGTWIERPAPKEVGQ